MGSLPQVVEDFQGVLKVYSDGSIYRSTQIDFNFPVRDDGSAIWKDSLFNKSLNLRVRLYKPTTAAASLPILYYIHGGGFCLGSCTWPNCHNCCLRLSSAFQAVVISPDYRLAPEHRLPAAIDDTVGSFKWLQAQALLTPENRDPWFSEGVDFDRVYVVGDSSGGNIAHHLAVRIGSGLTQLEPVHVRGFVLLAPFFGGAVRTRSEAEGPCEEALSLEILDRFWRLSIPVGDTRDHPFANPFGPNSPSLEKVILNPILVIVGGSEIMRERVYDYARRLKEMGKKIEYVEFEGKQHGFFTNDPYSEESTRLLRIIDRFMSENSN